MRAPRRIVLAVSAVLLLVSCSDGGGEGGGNAPPETYVRDLCTSVQTWVDDVETLSTDFASGLDPAASIDEQKQAVLDFLDDALALTDRLIGEVDGAGVPAVEGGADLVDTIAESFRQTRGVLEDARARVEAAPTDDPETFAAELNEIGSTIQESLGSIGGALALTAAPELADAAREEPACQTLAGAAT